MKKILGLVAVTAMVGAMLLPATPASAQNAGAAVASCQVQLTWPGSGSATCGGPGLLPTEGHAYGAFLPDGPVCVPECPFSADVTAYGETCSGVAGEPPLLGTASGTLHVGGLDAGFSWRRVGLVAVVTLTAPTTGAGVAAFLPDPRGLPTCAAPGTLTAHVLGLAVAEQP